MTKEELAALINKNISSDDVHTTVVIGHFLSWYGIAEMGVTNILFALSKASDLSRFSILCRGMDAKTKIERIKQLAALDHGIGHNLAARLDYFHRRIAGLRNRIAHSAVREKSNSPGHYQILTIGIWDHLTEFDDLDSIGTDFTAKEILGLAAWLMAFSDDVGQAISAINAGKIPEIDDPQTSLPAADPMSPPRPKNPTKKRKPQERAS